MNTVYALALLAACVATSLAQGGGRGQHTRPTTLAACIAQETPNATLEAARQQKMAQMKTCAQQCFPQQSSNPIESCFQNAHQGGSSEQSQRGAQQQQYLSCIQSAGCSSSPIPRTSSGQTSGGSGHHWGGQRGGSGAYNASSPRDQQRCAQEVLRALGKPATPSARPSQATMQQAGTCMKQCLGVSTTGGNGGDDEEGGHGGFHGKGGFGGGHRGGRGGGCLDDFCTEAQMETCKQSAGITEHQQPQGPNAATFTQTCTCVTGANTGATLPAYLQNFNCGSLPSTDVCTQIFQDQQSRRGSGGNGGKRWGGANQQQGGGASANLAASASV